jgi:hypothetical protein
MTSDPMHDAYLNGSPFYASLLARYGRTLSEPVAASICQAHDASLAELEAEVHWTAGRVSTLDLVQILGY